MTQPEGNGGSRLGRPPAHDGIWRGGTLAGLDPLSLAGSFGTPLFVYDLGHMEGRLNSLRAVLPARFDVAYAVKANPALAVVAHLASLGAGADVASAGELAAARRAGMDPARVVVTGPGKRDAFLLEAVRAGVRAVTMESLLELKRLERIAGDERRRTPVLLRLATTDPAGADRRRLIGGRGPAKFGMDVDDARLAAARLASSTWLEFAGVHSFGASNVLDAATLADHAAATMDAGRDLAAVACRPLRCVDVGGGLGIPYEAHEDPLDLADFGARLRQLDETWSSDPALQETRVLLEPGRFLVGVSGAYLATVVDVKRLDGRVVAILDGGVHHLLRPALVGQEQRIRLIRSAPAENPAQADALTAGTAAVGARGRPARLSAPSRGGPRPVPVVVAGPLCTGIDMFSGRAILPEPRPGDLVAVLDAGAYGFTEAMPYFLSHPTAAEVAVLRGDVRLIRPRVDPAELLERQVLPDW